MPMTTEEHALFMGMFTKQQQHIMALLEILRSRGIVTGDDAAAFRFAVATDVASNAALFRDVKATYIQFAKTLGISLPPDIENL